MLELKNVSKVYHSKKSEDTTALENVSLKFSEIQKCTASVENGQKKVIIYTTYGNHEFLGGDNYEQVAKTIQNALNR